MCKQILVAVDLRHVGSVDDRLDVAVTGYSVSSPPLPAVSPLTYRRNI